MKKIKPWNKSFFFFFSCAVTTSHSWIDGDSQFFVCGGELENSTHSLAYTEQPKPAAHGVGRAHTGALTHEGHTSHPTGLSTRLEVCVTLLNQPNALTYQYPGGRRTDCTACLLYYGVSWGAAAVFSCPVTKKVFASLWGLILNWHSTRTLL